MPGDDGNTVVIPLLPPRTAEALAQRGQRRDFRFPENTEQEKKICNILYADVWAPMSQIGGKTYSHTDFLMQKVKKRNV